jgi:plasmid stabilization system protein ParE
MSDPKRKRLYESGFKYTPAAETDIRKTFARIKRQQTEAAKAQPANVKQLRKAK